jgi:hypothetical protein
MGVSGYRWTVPFSITGDVFSPFECCQSASNAASNALEIAKGFGDDDKSGLRPS